MHLSVHIDFYVVAANDVGLGVTGPGEGLVVVGARVGLIVGLTVGLAVGLIVGLNVGGSG